MSSVNPLLQFDSPRRFANDPANNEGKEIQATPRTQLGPGLVARLVPADPLPGEAQTMVLDVAGAPPSPPPEPAELPGGTWNIPDVIATGGTFPLTDGVFQRVNTTGGDTYTLVLPLSETTNKGRRIAISEDSGDDAATNGATFIVATVGGNVINQGVGATYNMATTKNLVLVADGNGTWAIESFR